MKLLTLAALLLILATPALAAKVSCKDFRTQAEAQRYHDSKKGKTQLDRDKDGEACECLPGGSNYGTARCRK